MNNHTGQIGELRKSVDSHQSMIDTMRGVWWAFSGGLAVLFGVFGIALGLIGKPIAEWAIEQVRDHLRPRIK